MNTLWLIVIAKTINGAIKECLLTLREQHSRTAPYCGVKSPKKVHRV